MDYYAVGHVTLVAIAETSNLVPSHLDKSL